MFFTVTVTVVALPSPKISDAKGSDGHVLECLLAVQPDVLAVDRERRVDSWLEARGRTLVRLTFLEKPFEYATFVARSNGRFRRTSMGSTWRRGG